MTITEAFSVFEMHVMHNEGMKPKTRANYLMAVKSLMEVTGDINVEHIGMDFIIRWKLMMRDNGLKSTTINTNLGKIRKILCFLEEDLKFKVLDYHKIKREKEIRTPHVWLTPDEIDRLVAAAKTPRDKAIIDGYFATGCRLTEFLNLDREDIEKAELRIVDGKKVYETWVLGKNDKYRPVYLTTRVKDRIDNYLETRNDRFKPLFMSNQNRRLGPSRVEKMIHEVTRIAGLEKHVTPHTIRHSFASDLAVNNAPVLAISNLLGHKDANVTLGIYTHMNNKQGLSAYAAAHTDTTH